MLAYMKPGGGWTPEFRPPRPGMYVPRFWPPARLAIPNASVATVVGTLTDSTAPAGHALTSGEDGSPIVAHAHDGEAVFRRGLQRFAIRLGIGKLTHRVVVIDENLEVRTRPAIRIPHLSDVAARSHVPRDKHRPRS